MKRIAMLLVVLSVFLVETKAQAVVNRNVSPPGCYFVSQGRGFAARKVYCPKPVVVAPVVIEPVIVDQTPIVDPSTDCTDLDVDSCLVN